MDEAEDHEEEEEQGAAGLAAGEEPGEQARGQLSLLASQDTRMNECKDGWVDR